MRSTDLVDPMVDGEVELDRLPIRCHLTAEELDAAVAVQLEQRAEQGFREVPPIVLSRVGQIVATARWGVTSTVASPCLEDQAEFGRAA